MRIYTRTGDKGETGLFGGKRVSKASLRIEAYGTVDELNSVLGLAGAEIQDVQIAALVRALQNELHIVEAELANPSEGTKPCIQAPHVAELEKQCDLLEAELPPLRKFILPGGSRLGAQLHLARTVARRAERRVVALAAKEAVNPEMIKYLNRLSDLLFLLARAANHRTGTPEIHPTY
jgi:cob(I)alamin adenosyltransferase